jgi:MFS family permease
MSKYICFLWYAIEKLENKNFSMLKKIIYRLTHRHHYWRTVGFDELSELYTNITFRSLAQSTIGIFVPVYLYNSGYSIDTVLLFMGGMYIVWQTAAFLVAWLIAQIGPKHTILWSQIILSMALGLLITLNNYHWSLWLIALFMGISNAMFFVSFHVDFSKVKHSEHGGKEVGWMFAMQKLGVGLGPILGGLVAYFFGAQYIFLVCLLLLFFGTLPLFLTAEPVKLHQKISFEGISLRKIKYDLISWSALSVETMASVVVWPFFVGVYIFADNPYLKLGIVVSASVVVTFFASRAIGEIIDKKKGRSMLRVGAVLNAGLHLFRPFANSLTSVLSINIVNEVVTPMYRMPLTKGLFDSADDYPGRRIAYIAVMESFSCFARAVFFLALAMLASFNPKQAFIIGFMIGAVASLILMKERFKALSLS